MILCMLRSHWSFPKAIFWVKCSREHKCVETEGKDRVTLRLLAVIHFFTILPSGSGTSRAASCLMGAWRARSIKMCLLESRSRSVQPVSREQKQNWEEIWSPGVRTCGRQGQQLILALSPKACGSSRSASLQQSQLFPVLQQTRDLPRMNLCQIIFS